MPSGALAGSVGVLLGVLSLPSGLAWSGMIRALERDLGGKWSSGGRLCLDVPRAALASSKFTPSEKGMVRALACNAIWTPDRAIA
eukprot:3221296-Pyramimonas_sp.AAC.1